MDHAYLDTITGIATAPGQGGVSIVRVSGRHAADILFACFRTHGAKSPDEITDHLMRYGHVLAADGSVIDEAMGVLFRAPRSYTREDVAEIHVHGGRLCAEQTLMRTVELGARIALPGEFTRRAFENGRIDLSQAEAVMDAIRADGALAGRAAQQQLSGALRSRIENFQDRLTMLLAKIDASADYPDEDLDEETRISCVQEFQALDQEMEQLLCGARDARHIRDGVATAIFGAPNAGKSSLLNLLLGSDRAIVTPIAGTTRDTLEERLILRGLVFRLIDTAGIRATDDAVESIGVDRAKATMQQADLLLYVVDCADNASFEPEPVIRLAQGKKLIVLLNKSDLPAVITNEDILSHFPQAQVISICARSGEGAQQVRDALYESALENRDTSSAQLLLGNARHIALLESARRTLARGLSSALSGMPVDILGVDVQEVWQTLGQITGNSCEENVIDAIFANFCVGK